MSNEILDWNYKPSVYKFYQTAEGNIKYDNKIFLGVELELECEEIDGFLSRDKYDFFYYKEDESLETNESVEIVSHPATLDYHLTSNVWNDMFENILDCNLYASDECGMHVHVNRENLTQGTIASLDYVINNFSYYIEELGGRTFDDEYYRLADKEINEYGHPKGCRYYALNLSNENTIEFRFFNSTTNKKIFYENLKVVIKLIEYCRNNNINKLLMKNQTLEKFKIEFKKIGVNNV